MEYNKKKDINTTWINGGTISDTSKEVINRMAAQIMDDIAIWDVINLIKCIGYSSNKQLKTAYKRLLFLAMDTNAPQLVEKAFAEWESNPLFNGVDHFCDLDKLLIIGAFHEVQDLKEKQKDSTPITADEVVDKVYEWIPVDEWNTIHMKKNWDEIQFKKGWDKL